MDRLRKGMEILWRPTRRWTSRQSTDWKDTVALPSGPTIVTYPDGATRGAAVVLHLARNDNGTTAILLNATPCHPIDAGWPDQGPDRAVIHHRGTPVQVLDCVVAASDGAELFTGADIPVKKGAEGWTFAVAHIVDDAATLAEGDEVEVEVDEGYRTALSTGHTACHVASLALNKALSDRWKKEVRDDGLGTPDFDGLAIDASRIVENGSVDTYRLGKSLRRKGFITEGLQEALPDLENTINEALRSWVDSGAAVRIDRDGRTLTDLRHWVCELPEGTVRIPCGGTHLGSLKEVSSVQVALSLDETEGTPVLWMETTATTA